MELGSTLPDIAHAKCGFIGFGDGVQHKGAVVGKTVVGGDNLQVGIDTKQVVFLMVLQCDRVMPDEQIMKENGIFDHEFVAFLDPLIDQGLVVHENGKVFVTEGTENVLSKFWAIKDRAEQKILSCLSQEENAVFTTLMDRVVEHCEELIRNNSQQ